MRYITFDDYIKKDIQKPIKLSKDYMAGFIDGEGCFAISTKRKGKDSVKFSFSITMRKDALPLINTINKTIGGLGRICFSTSNYEYSKKGSSAPTIRKSPSVHILVGRYENMLRLIKWMDDAPLVLKKREYEIWKEAVLFYVKHRPGSGWNNRITPWVLDKVRGYVKQLREERKYKETDKYNVDNNVIPERVERKLDDFIVL